jgi:hypothetical protein
MILADLPVLELVPSGWTALPLLLLAAMNCFLGYFVFRAIVVLHGALVGGVLGAMLVGALTTEPGGSDYVVACGGLGLAGALLGWFNCRMGFAASWGACAVGLAAWLAGPRCGAGGWALILLAGIVFGGACYSYIRRMVPIVCGVAGALGTVAVAFHIIAGPRLPSWAGMVLLAVLAVGLAVTGMLVQVKLANLFTDFLTPDAALRRKPPRPAANVHPRLTRV